MKCTKCGSTDIQIQVVTEKEKVGFWKVVFHIMLCFIIIGIPFLLLDFLKLFRTKTVTYAVCNDCGKRWQIG